MITDDTQKLAALAIYEDAGYRSRHNARDGVTVDGPAHDYARLAIEAVAPAIRAEGYRAGLDSGGPDMTREQIEARLKELADIAADAMVKDDRAGFIAIARALYTEIVGKDAATVAKSYQGAPAVSRQGALSDWQVGCADASLAISEEFEALANAALERSRHDHG